jgi:ureidoacrylate peracid hydrolase
MWRAQTGPKSAWLLAAKDISAACAPGTGLAHAPGMNACNPSPYPIGLHPANQWRATPDHADMVREPLAPRPIEVEAQSKRIRFDAARSALVIVDMQNDFCHPDGWLGSIGVNVAPARQPIEPLAALLPAWRASGGAVVWLNWGNRRDLANVPPAVLHVYKPHASAVGLGEELPSAMQPSMRRNAQSARVLEAGSWGAAIVDGLEPACDDVHVDKYRMSGFFDTCLDSVLRQRGVQTVLFAGVNADQCVLATLMDANCMGYDTVLLEDCSATTSPDYCWQATLYNVRQCFGFSTTGAQITAALQGSA